MKISVHIVEDEMLVAHDIASDLETAGFEVNGISISSKEVLSAIQKHPPHLIIMDIQIKGDLDGIETVEKIKNLVDCPIIYLTSSTNQQTVSRALLTQPHAFISKPYNQKDLIIAIELAIHNYNEKTFVNQNEVSSIFVKLGEFYRKIMLSEILYIEAKGSYCNVNTLDKTYTISLNLNRFQKEIKAKSLVRVHRSFAVNCDKVDGVNSNSLLIGKNIIPVSNTYKEIVNGLFKKI